MAGLPDNILSQIANVGTSERLAQCYLTAIDLPGSEIAPWQGAYSAEPSIAFQYWPETLTDSRTSEWTSKPIPGGSHPIYQWSSGGERRISFTSIFTTDTNPGDDFGTIQNDFGTSISGDPYDLVKDRPLSGLELGRRDLDIRSAAAWLRWFTYPSYEGPSGDRAYSVYEPCKCLLVLPNTSLGHDGSDGIVCAMLDCEVTYQAWFPSGLPRILEVSLSFAELVQQGNRVQFHSRRNMTRARTVGSYLGRRPETGR